MTLFDLVTRAARELEQAGIAPREAALDAELLARHLLGWDRATWLLRRREPVPAGIEARYATLVERRCAREPLAYVRGVQEFWGRDFAVNPAVLIPRPETELIVEQALASLPASQDARIIDIGTGSGCIAITLALERPRAHVIATDVSPAALEVGRENASCLGAANISFVSGAYFAGASGPFDLVVSNPPYVSETDGPGLAPEVLREPHMALFAQSDGLSVVGEILQRSVGHLRTGGRAIVEIGFGQQRAVEDAIAALPQLRLISFCRDLQGIPRVIVCERR